MKIWEKNEAKKMDRLSDYNIPTANHWSPNIQSWTVLHHFLLYFPVVVFSKIKWFCTSVILWQLSCFLESWVKHVININRTQHNGHLLAFHVSKSWDLNIGKYRKWEVMFLNVYGTVSMAMQVSGYSAEVPQTHDSSLTAVKSCIVGI